MPDLHTQEWGGGWGVGWGGEGVCVCVCVCGGGGGGGKPCACLVGATWDSTELVNVIPDGGVCVYIYI